MTTRAIHLELITEKSTDLRHSEATLLTVGQIAEQTLLGHNNLVSCQMNFHGHLSGNGRYLVQAIRME